MTIGGTNPSLYEGSINYHKVIDKYYWEMKADNILVGGNDVGLCKNGCRVIADTGTSLITGPTDDLYQLFDAIDVEDNCNNVAGLPDITFVLDSIDYTLTAEEYVLTVSDDGTEYTVDNMKKNGMST